MAAPPASDRTIQLAIPARPEFIGLGRLALSGLARLPGAPLSDEVLADVKLAVTEACTNVVRHAYDGGEGIVELEYELLDDRIVVEVRDDGNGFEVDVRDPLVDDGDLVEGGLGLAIIHALADEVEITARATGGSSLRFSKLLATTAG